MVIKAALGIDQSLTNTGITLIDSKGLILIQSTSKTKPDDGEDYYRCQMIIEDINTALIEYEEKTGEEIDYSELVVAREDHSFQLHGRAGANLLLAGRIDQYFAVKNIVHKINYFIVPDRDWKKKFLVKKPNNVGKKKENKLTPVKIRDIYLSNYPGYGSNEHELDSFWIAFYGITKYMEDLKNVVEETEAE